MSQNRNYALFDRAIPVQQLSEPEPGMAVNERGFQFSFFEERTLTSDIPLSVQKAGFVELEQVSSEPGIYFVTSSLEKVGERELPEKITTVQEAANATAYLSRYAVEHYDAIVTDINCRPLAVIGSFKGAETQTSVYPSTVIKELSKIKGAKYLWASHNHPSGEHTLSQADRSLSVVFEELLRGSGVVYQGMIAVTQHQFSSTQHGEGVISQDAGKKLRIPVVERMLTGVPNHTLTMSAPKVAKKLVQQIAKDVPGIVFLSSQHAAVSFIPVNPEELSVLRTEGRLMRLFNAAASSGASGAIIANPNNAIQTTTMEVGGRTAANNLASALQAIDVRVMDVITYDPLDPDRAMSESERNTLNPYGVFFSKENGPAIIPHNTRSARQALVNSFNGSSKASIAALLDSGQARVITAQQAQHLAGADALFMTAWHGSTHDHDKFDMSKVGTGEGNQAYGYGLYFAENKEVAEHYKNVGSGITYKLKNGDILSQSRLEKYIEQKAEWKHYRDGDVKRVIRSWAERESDKNPFAGIRGDGMARNVFNELLKLVDSHKINSKLYQVELTPAEDEYLLWDKPLSEQSKKVRAALYEVINREEGYRAIERGASGDVIYKSLASDFATRERVGVNIINGKQNDKAASEYLHSIGIRGIKYLDGSSRNVGKGTYNYVIFDDKDVLITAKDGQKLEQSEIPVTETGAFKTWFGNSKAITGDGKPKILYHGTGADISVFDNSKAPEKMDKNRDGAFWFSSAPEVAGHFAGEQSGEIVYGTTLGFSNILPVYLNIQNPFVDRNGRYARGGGLNKEDILELEADGYDGVHWPQADVDLPDTTMEGPVQGYYRNRHGKAWGETIEGYPDQWAAFHPEQIKSAIGNNGQFNANNPDIRHSKDGSARTLAFYNPIDSTTYFIADHISKEYTSQEWRGLALHEIAVHAMQLGRSNEEFKSILNEFERMKNAGDVKVIEAFNKVPAKTRPENVVEEALAYYIQHNQDLPIAQRFGAWMRSCIRAMGKALPFTQRAPWSAWANTLTPYDLVYMAQAALSSNSKTAQREYKGGTALAAKVNERFYSQLYKVMRDAPEKIFSNGEQVSAWLMANHGKLGVKKDEIYWSGIEDWLNTQGKITKDAVLGYLDSNGVKIDEVILGGSKEDFPMSYEDLPKVVQLLVDQIDQGNLDIAEFNDQMSSVGYYADVDMGGELEGIYRIGAAGQLTQHHAHQLPGGENYRELLLTLPKTENAAVLFTEADKAKLSRLSQKVDSGEIDYYSNPEEWNQYKTLIDKSSKRYTGEDTNFKSAHFDPLNIVAHIRFNERTDVDGKRVLFIDELQSDWGQKGKKEGFSKVADKSELDAMKEEMSALNMRELTGPQLTQTEYVRLDELIKLTKAGVASTANTPGVPSSPFVTDTKAWTALALKRMVSYAAENGFDKIAWATGLQQAERFKLSKKVETIAWFEAGGGIERSVNIVLPDSDQQISLSVDINNKIMGMSEFKGRSLESVVGKNVAEKIMASPSGTLMGEDLYIGVHGMSSYYDQIVPQVANDILKKVGGGKVEQIIFDGDDRESMYVLDAEDVGADPSELQEVIVRDRTTLDGVHSPFHCLAEAEAWLDKHDRDIGVSNQQGFSITPEMRSQNLNTGLPLFSVEANKSNHQSADYQRESGPLHIDDMHEEISRIRGQWPSMPPVHVINDVSELPFAVNKQARGIYSQDNIYIVAPKIYSIPELQKVMAHEYILHHSFFEMFDSYEFSKIHAGIQSLKNKGDPVICKIAEHLAQVYDPLSPEDETREIIAHAGESCLDERGNIKIDHAFMKPVFANIASWLRDHGIGVPWSNFELQGVIINAGKYAKQENKMSLTSLKEKSGLYSGKILDIQGNIVIQKTGCKLTDVERHLFSASATKPIIGEVVNIAYKNKQPTVLMKEKSKGIDI